MKKSLFLLFTLLLTLYGGTGYAFGPKIAVDNRVLTVVRDRPITVLDVMKRMDLVIQENFPDIIDNLPMCYQFYAGQWKVTLDRMIETELMLADAESIEVTVTDGEIRETMQERFGPNIIATLDKLGFSYDEARKLIHDELIQQRMSWFRFQSQALMRVHPVEIKEAFQKHLKENPPKETWQYHVISVRDANREAGEKIAAAAYQLMALAKEDLDTLPTRLAAMNPENKNNVQISQLIEVDNKNLSNSHREILELLTPGSYSNPIAQTSRADQAIVHRIFYLIDHVKNDPPVFKEILHDLEMQLVMNEIQKNQAQYMKKLKKRLAHEYTKLEDMVPIDFQPFVLQ